MRFLLLENAAAPNGKAHKLCLPSARTTRYSVKSLGLVSKIEDEPSALNKPSNFTELP